MGLPDNESVVNFGLVSGLYQALKLKFFYEGGGVRFHVLMKNNNLKLFVDTIAWTCPAG